MKDDEEEKTLFYSIKLDKVAWTLHHTMGLLSILMVS